MQTPLPLRFLAWPLLLATAAMAQTVTARTAPRAAWTVVPGVTGTPTTLPWTTRVFRALGTGFGPQSLGLSMMGLTQFAPGAVPLPTLPIPGGGAGCDLLTSLEINGLELPTAGQVDYGIYVPGNDPTLIGLPIFLQLAELDFSAGWVGTYTSNGIRLTVGAM